MYIIRDFLRMPWIRLAKWATISAFLREMVCEALIQFYPRMHMQKLTPIGVVFYFQTCVYIHEDKYTYIYIYYRYTHIFAYIYSWRSVPILNPRRIFKENCSGWCAGRLLMFSPSYIGWREGAVNAFARTIGCQRNFWLKTSTFTGLPYSSLCTQRWHYINGRIT